MLHHRNSHNLDSEEVVLGSSDVMQELWQLVGAAARGNTSVLIRGETGAGKEIVARQLHLLSARRKGPFIAINCGAIPADLLESELFGHRKGAFTGAISDYAGQLLSANGGTLFLDEIGDMPRALQVKLLRVLEERVIVPVGSTERIPIDVRVVSATHQDLEVLTEQKLFREDLFYRLNVFPLLVPALRDRLLDLPELISFFSRKLVTEGEVPTFTDESMKILRGYHWPGNLRELSNLVARMHAISPTAVMDITTVPKSLLPARICEAIQSIASRGRSVAAEAHTGPMMDAQELMDDRLEQALGFTQSDVPLPKDGFALKDLLQDIEVNVIRKALDSTQWNVSSAAKLLDMHRTTLIQKISKLDIAQDNSPVTN